MKTGTKLICKAAGISLAFILSSTMAAIIWNYLDSRKYCGVYSCDDSSSPAL